MSGTLVGRDRELAEIEAALTGGADGGLRAVVLTGEAGIGKSSVLAAMSGHLGRDWHVLATRADPLEREIPHAALAGLVAPLVGDADAEVAGLATEALATLDALGEGSRAAVVASFGQICGQLTRLVRALLERRPVAIVIDDLHAVDDDGLAALAIVLRRVASGRVALVAASRLAPPSSSPALDELLRRVGTDGALTLLALGPLDPASVTELVGRAIGTPDRGRLDAVIQRAEGNPFFALLLASSPEPTGTGRSAILQRFAPLDAQARAVLRAVAVLGRVALADLTAVTAATGLSATAAAAAFDELVAANVLERDEHGFGFTHDLVREAVYGEIGPAEQQRLHRAVADHLLASRAAGRAVDILSLARHLAESAEAGDEEAARVLAEAGDRSRTVAPGSAVSLYGRALELAPPDSSLRPLVLAHRCRALVLATRVPEAVAVGRAALEALPPGTRERTRTASAVISSLFELGRIEEALAAADAELVIDPESAIIRSQRPMLLWFSSRFDEARREWHRARTLPLNSDAERILVLGQLAFGAATFYEQCALLDITAELERLARSAPATLRLFALAMAAYTLAMDGCVDRALPLLQQAETMLEDAGGTPFRGNIAVARVMVDWLQGRWDEAIDGAAAGAAELEGAQLAIYIGGFHAVEIDIRSTRGEWVPATLVDPIPVTRNMADLKASVVAGLHESHGDLDAARATIAATRAGSGEGAAYLPVLLGRLTDIELAAGDRAAAGAALEELEATAAGMVDPWTATWLHRARAQFGTDAEEARMAVEAAGAAGLAYERACSQVVLGQLDPAEVDALSAAYRTFQELGADAARRRAGALLTARGAKVPRPRSTRAGVLTAAEMAIARLVQQGMRNKEIATFLHYSPRTVEVYLSRIYTKLSVSSRLELARTLDALPS